MRLDLKKIFPNIGNEPIYLNGPAVVAIITMAILRWFQKEDPETLDVEHVFVYGLNGRSRVIYVDETCRGLEDSALITPRSIFRQAVKSRVCSIIMAHNHPSATLHASEDDLRVTERIKSASAILEIKLLDHVIVADPQSPDIIHEGNVDKPYFSFQQAKLL
jgi:DNA repair protein RadC